MKMKKFLNEGLPLESGIRAALRHHTNQLKRYKVRTDLWLHNLHQQAVELLTKMEGQYAGRGSKEVLAECKKKYLALSCAVGNISRADLLGLVPAELLDGVGGLNIEAARRRDVLDLILHHE